MFTPELLSPAGSLKALNFAFAYGADAVYAGQPRYSLRVRNNEFKSHDKLREAINTAHKQDKKFYLVSNISPHNAKIKTFMDDIAPIIDMQPDALIMSDPGLIMMVRDRWPDMPVHLSVQANVTNFAGVKFWQRQGIERIILSRELSIEEIAEIRQEVPDMELEVFVHGALCIAYSGRCLLSGYMNHRDPNQGACTNACRWGYDAKEASEDLAGNVLETPVQTYNPKVDENTVVLLEEKSRPGELMPAYEDEHGTYILNSKDLRAIQHVPRLTSMGVHSLKIEGRTKSHFYVARTAQLYRQAIDDAVAGRPFNMNIMDKLEGLANRGYTEGFYRRHVHDEFQNYEQGTSKSDKQQFVGEILPEDSSDELTAIEVKNKFDVGDSIEVMTPNGNTTLNISHMENYGGKAVSSARGSGHKVKIPLPKNLRSNFGLILKNFQHQ